jgi:adenylylsulfate kinase
MKKKIKEPFAVWLTGIPSSGKTTLARGLSEKLREMGVKVVILESDELRKLLTPNPQYTEEERDYFYRAMAVIGRYLVDNGISVIFDATAHKRKYRENARKLIKNFIEVYVYAPLEVCLKRDVKGLYSKALKGEIKTLPGLQEPYEEPPEPDVKLETHIETIEASLVKIISVIKTLP